MPLKGNTNNPNGRKKGSPNSFTKDMKAYLMEVLDMRKGEILLDLEELTPKDRLKFIIDLLPYVLPKLQATSNETRLSVENLTEKQIDEMLNNLQQEKDVRRWD